MSWIRRLGTGLSGGASFTICLLTTVPTERLRPVVAQPAKASAKSLLIAVHPAVASGDECLDPSLSHTSHLDQSCRGDLLGHSLILMISLLFSFLFTIPSFFTF